MIIGDRACHRAQKIRKKVNMHMKHMTIDMHMHMGPVWPRPDTRLNVSRRRSPTAQYTRASALYLYVRISIMLSPR